MVAQSLPPAHDERRYAGGSGDKTVTAMERLLTAERRLGHSVTEICVSAKTVVVPWANTWALMTCAPTPSVPVPHVASPPNRQYFGMLS